ncbi:MAG: response regulator transcription factor, partial [Anaerolineae bacterium]|nr:response regulator transcription factor [Anaerolineae bacterium]
LGGQVQRSLGAAGFDVRWVTRADDAMVEELEGLSLIILDLMLPGGHGLDVLKYVRTSQHQVPVLILSARTETTDKVRALELGADDYLTKPFWPEELLARVKARLRRPALSLDQSVLDVGRLRLNVDGRAAAVDQIPIDLTRVEFDLLHALAKRPGTAVSRAWLVDHVLDPDRD